MKRPAETKIALTPRAVRPGRSTAYPVIDRIQRGLAFAHSVTPSSHDAVLHYRHDAVMVTMIDLVDGFIVDRRDLRLAQNMSATG